MKPASIILLGAVFAGTCTLSAKTPDGKPLVVLIAGKPSHGPGEHEHNAGVKLLAKCLAQGAPNVVTKVQLNAEWPDEATLNQADTVLIYSDGGGGHPAVQGERLASLRKQMERGCGFVCLHYAVEVEKERGGSEFLDWLGGYFEKNWSVNPHWTADYRELPKHPISNGVKPFSTKDEWYYHMRFRDRMQGVTAILSDAPPESSVGKDGSHSGNPTVRAEVAAKTPQHTAWASERPNGGRGFGFTGGHFHRGWGNDDQRKLVLNAILWTAKADIPATGVESKITAEELEANQDPKGARKPAAAVVPKGTAITQTELVKGAPVPINAEIKGANELFLVVTDGGDGFVADWANWIEPTLVKADGSKIKLTDLKPKVAEVGWGKLGINQNVNGQPMRVGGQPVAFGFGTHAPSLVAFDLPDGVVSFQAKGGLDNGGTDQGAGSTVVFKVFTGRPADAAKASPASTSRYGLEKARESLTTFKAADGLSVGLFAAEPMIINPTNIDVDHRGRVWGTECTNYRRYGKIRPEGDRVVILEDKNGDGTADESKTFFQNPELTNPLGICVLPQAKGGTKVIVSAAPNVWLLTDKDGDDKADDAIKIFKTTGTWDYDHQIHAFVFGPDGKFYFNFGDAATSLTGLDGTPIKDVAGNDITNKGKPYRKGMVFRCDLDLETGKATNVETLGWNFRNNYEVAVDSFGAMWQSDNDDDGNKAVRINYVMDYGNFGYTDEFTGAGWSAKRTNLESEIPRRHWYQNDPGVVPNLLVTGAGSPTGILVNEGDGLGAQFKNQMIHCDAGPRTTRAYPVQKDGAGYTATMVDLLTSSDQWYRVADLAIAPDGALLVADWYDPGVGGHNMGDHEPGQMMGRVYRVGTTGTKPTVAKVDVSTAEGAVAALQSPNLATRSMGWRALHAMGAAAEPELLKLWKSSDARLRARALGILVQIPGREFGHLTAGMTDADSDVRCWAIRLTRMLINTRGFDPQQFEGHRELVGKLLRDPSAQVRREVALSLHQKKDIDKLWTALALQHDGKDRWYLEALGIGAAGNEDACFDSWMEAVGMNWNTPAGRDIIWRLRSAKAASYLVKFIEDSRIAAEEKPRFLRAFDFLPPSPERNKSLLELATAGKVGDALAREALVRLKGSDLNAEPQLKAAIDGALEKAKGTPQFVELVRDFGLKGQAAALLDTATRIGNDPLAAEAIRLVFADPEGKRALDAALGSPKAEAVLSLLGTSGSTRALDHLVSLAKDGGQKMDARQQAVRSLSRTQAGAEQLVKLAKAGQFPEDLKLAAASALAQVQYANLKDQIAELFPMPNALGGQPLPAIAELVKLKGDIALGKAVTERLESSCVTCHRIGDKGVDFGPALSEIGAKLPKEALFEAIINPNSGVSMGFETWQFTLKDGGMAMGLIRSETGEEVILALPGGASMKVARANIAKREKQANSMMPSGLNQALSKDDLVNMVEYLASLKAK